MIEITDELIKKATLEVIKESKDEILKKLQEADETEAPDTSDEPSDESGDEGGSGNSASSSDGSDGGSENIDPEKEIDNLSRNVAHGFNTPKNLVLNDGTETHIATDSSHQKGDVDQDEDNYEITFEKGNWSLFSQSAKLYSQKVTIIRQTLAPLIEKALIELLETSGAYDRKSFNSSAYFINDDFRVIAEFHYQVDLWIGTDFDPASVEHDQGYIYQTIAVIPSIKIETIKIDTDSGDLTIIASV